MDAVDSVGDAGLAGKGAEEAAGGDVGEHGRENHVDCPVDAASAATDLVRAGLGSAADVAAAAVLDAAGWREGDAAARLGGSAYGAVAAASYRLPTPVAAARP